MTKAKVDLTRACVMASIFPLSTDFFCSPAKRLSPCAGQTFCAFTSSTHVQGRRVRENGRAAPQGPGPVRPGGQHPLGAGADGPEHRGAALLEDGCEERDEPAGRGNSAARDRGGAASHNHAACCWHGHGLVKAEDFTDRVARGGPARPPAPRLSGGRELDVGLPRVQPDVSKCHG